MVAKYTRQGVDQARKYGARLTFAFGKKKFCCIKNSAALKISNISAYRYDKSAFQHTATKNISIQPVQTLTVGHNWPYKKLPTN